MKLINTEEIVENGVTYIVNTYDNGTVEQFAKPDPNAVPSEPERQPAVTNEQLKDLALAGMQGTADLYLVEQENKQLQLDTMQGIADLYAMQMGGGQ